MKLFICANDYTEKQNEEANSIILQLYDEGHEICEKPEDAELIISLGGDGALLRGAQTALVADRPLLGINSGRLGYLCAMKADEVSSFADILKECVLTERTVLVTEYDDQIFYSLNDVIVSKSNFGSTVDLELLVEDRPEMEIRGDGLIVATPTGSTAYNLSAGGSRLDIDTGVLSLTPICPHHKDIYPKVISDRKTVTVRVNHGDAQVYADGRHLGSFTDRIVISKAERTLKLYSRS